ncbi:valine--tRNA ligase-like isoform X2 [Plodia interpunctella]|uniref:valine--tRNA ligase-like isoform X2 n=1 Tax=Plodia interpunctella TaxID=58824 RepID=UPI0023689D54|nr:valine--tRNA ligase-like isoform X2 [Plodia interpunctella]
MKEILMKIKFQGVVEKYMENTMNTSRRELGREQFIKEVMKWKDKHGNSIYEQLKRLGCSLDWTRQNFTMDNRHTHAVNTAFIELFKKGLIYRRKALVNWCTKLNSTISDIEIDNVLIKGPTEIKVPDCDKPVKFGLMYHFAYKVIDSDQEIVVATTMPETMLGDTAIAVNPEDERYRDLIGRAVYHPFRNTPIPIIGDDVVDINFGTGAVKITPAHSKVDFEIGQAHFLQIHQVINECGNMVNCDHQFKFKNRYECREVIVNLLKEMSLLKDIVPHEMTLPTCSRTGDIIFYLPKEQWFLACSELNKSVVDALKSGKLKVLPEKFEKNWLQWAEDDRDWCISRQLWWGHQVPAFKCSVDNHLVWIACTDINTAKLEASKFLRTMPAEIKAVRDTDVLDTWFSSAIYPFAVMGWPDTLNKDYSLYYPLSLMATAHDILGFWVHRMAMLGLELTETLPFKNVLLHGVICDSKGAKMSKSKGNVIDPIDVINGISMESLKEKTVDMNRSGILSNDELKKALDYHKANFSGTKGIPQCGVDALRFTLLSQDVKAHFVNFDVYQCNANKLFCNKIYQSVKYTQMAFDKLKKTEDKVTRSDLTYFDKWILSRLSNMVEKVNKSMDSYDFHLATKAIRTLIYSEFCDIYLEATKSGFASDNIKMGYAHAHTLSAVLNTALRSLSPFMVYLTHELIPKIPNFVSNIIFNYDDASMPYFHNPRPEDFIIWKNDDFEKQSERLLKTLNLVREMKGLYGISNKVKPSVIVETKNERLAKDLEANKAVFLNLTRCGVLHFGQCIKNNVIHAPLDKDTKIGIEIIGEDVTDTIMSARSRLETKIRKLEYSVAKMEEKLANSGYLSSVPEWTQVIDRERLTNKKEELDNLRKLLEENSST